MGRFRIVGTLLAGLAAAAPARGAEITRVLSSGEPDSPFGFSLEVRYQFLQRQAKIAREFGNNGAAATGIVDLGPELDYSQASHRIIPRLAVGIVRDVEIHAELPYVLFEDSKWTNAGGATSGILLNSLDASGAPCGSACPMFPVASGNQLHAGAALDDLRVGFSWGILSEQRDPVGPTWLVSFDLTVPSAARWDPADKRTTRASFDAGPPATSSARAAVGHKIWVYELGTALSRRLGVSEPYFKARIAIPQRSSQTYSNCEHATALAGIGEMWQGAGGVDASTECQSAEWKTRGLAQPPVVVGVTAGVEVVPQDDRATGQRTSLDFRMSGDYLGESRWYNELTAATGKLMHTDAYATLGAQVAFTYRSSRYFAFALRGSFQHELAHFVSGETRGGGALNGAGQNPNFDWRWDPAGRRFRVSETMIYGGSASLIFGF